MMLHLSKDCNMELNSETGTATLADLKIELYTFGSCFSSTNTACHAISHMMLQLGKDCNMELNSESGSCYSCTLTLPQPHILNNTPYITGNFSDMDFACSKGPPHNHN